MVAAETRCACPDCGTSCPGRFDACADVWQRGPVAAPRRAEHPSTPVASSAPPVPAPDPSLAVAPLDAATADLPAGEHQQLVELGERLGEVVGKRVGEAIERLDAARRRQVADELRTISAVVSDQSQQIDRLRSDNAQLRQIIDRRETADAVDRGLDAAARRLQAEVEALEGRLRALPPPS